MRNAHAHLYSARAFRREIKTWAAAREYSHSCTMEKSARITADLSATFSSSCLTALCDPILTRNVSSVNMYTIQSLHKVVQWLRLQLLSKKQIWILI